MKKLILILLIAISGHAQNDSIAKIEAKKYDRFTISVNTEPNAFIKDGFNIGADIEHYNKTIYVGAGVYLFPNLNNIGYTQFHAVHGLNFISKDEIRRYYFGGLAGFTIRENNPFILVGVESGFEYYLSKNLGIGLEGSILNRSAETGFYGNKEWVFNGGIKLIYRWK